MLRTKYSVPEVLLFGGRGTSEIVASVPVISIEFSQSVSDPLERLVQQIITGI